jgi:hypothetical protein
MYNQELKFTSTSVMLRNVCLLDEKRWYTLMVNTVNMLVEPLGVQEAVAPIEDEILQDEV